MSRILYYLVLKPLSHIPLSILYGFSYFLYWFLYKLIGYRAKVVRGNIERSFPNWTKKQVNNTVDKFYRHFSDIVVESVRAFSMPEAEFLRRARLVNPELLQQFYDAGQSVMIVCGHYNNWELPATCLNLQMAHIESAVYKRLGNSFMERKVYKSRTRFGLKLIEKKESKTWFANPEPGVFAFFFISDQSPTTSKQVYWTTFLHQETAFFTGAERISKDLNLPVIFIDLSKVKRGHYEMEMTLIEEHPQLTPDGQITEQYVQLLEKMILKDPSKWLWTHKRWKRKREKEIVEDEIAQNDF
ncbi:MAG: lysophospholipid acyltransferase family protein [Saprospiraceae bacterium]|nr:lysophospholipid acyltransferase family protein [Saprospiraceae bacterium]